MPVTKITPAAWSGHTAVAIREFTSRRLLVVTQSGNTVYFWISTDCGNTWAAHSGLASAAWQSGTNIRPPVMFVSPTLADNTVIVLLGTSNVGFNAYVAYRQFGEDIAGETVSVATNFRYSNTTYPQHVAVWRALSATDWAITIGSPSNVTQYQNYAGGNFRLSASTLGVETVQLTVTPVVGWVDWAHAGDGKTAVTGTLIYFGAKRPLLGSGPYTLGQSSSLRSSQGNLTITGAFEQIALADGANVWLAEDDDGDSSRLIRVPYSRLSQTAIDLGEAGDWQAFAHYQGRMFCCHSGDSGKVHILDTATSTFTSAEEQSHADFASDTFDAERYPVENAMFLVRTSSAEAAFYRVTLNTSPARPVLTVPVNLPAADDLTLRWTFVDSDGDSQSAIALRRRTETNTAWEYWDGNSWESAETRLTRTTQTITLGEADWLDDADDDHWFGIKAYDSSGGDGNASEWSADARVTPVPAPTVALVSLDAAAVVSGTQADVGSTDSTLVWTATAQDAYRIHLYTYDSSETGNRGDLLFDTGDLSSAAREHELEFDTDGERGILVLDVSYIGSEADEQSTEYLVDLPEPPGDSTTTVAVNGTYSDHLRVSASWSPPSGVSVSTAGLHRRVVSEGGDGVRLAAALPVASDAVAFDDWLVASGVAYEYRWRALSADGVATLDSTWTA